MCAVGSQNISACSACFWSCTLDLLACIHDAFSRNALAQRCVGKLVTVRVPPVSFLAAHKRILNGYYGQHYGFASGRPAF